MLFFLSISNNCLFLCLSCLVVVVVDVVVVFIFVVVVVVVCSFNASIRIQLFTRAALDDSGYLKATRFMRGMGLRDRYRLITCGYNYTQIRYALHELRCDERGSLSTLILAGYTTF